MDDLLHALGDESEPLPIHRLSELSDLTTEAFQQVELAWPTLPTERRRRIIEEIGQLAELHLDLLFERVNRLALHDPDAAVRRRAIRNLWECEDPALISDLLDLIQDGSSEGVRQAAAEALGRFIYLGELEEISRKQLKKIEQALLHAAAKDTSLPVRRKATESLGFSSREEVPTLIQEAFESDNVESRQTALLAMGRSANKRWRDEVLGQLSSPSPVLRAEAARAVGELELLDARTTVIELLDDVSDGVRHAAIWALGQLGGEAAAEALIKLQEEDVDSEEADLLQDSLDHLAFVDSTRDLLLFDFDESEDAED